MLVVVLAEHVCAVRQMEGAGAVAVSLGIHHVVGERGERDHRLHGRARRVGAAERPIEEWPVDVGLQRTELGGGDAAPEQRRIEARQAHERQHVAVVGIERHHGAAMSGERGFGGALHLEVDGEQQIIARRGRPRAQVRHEGALALHRAP